MPETPKWQALIASLDPARPVMIAGPTAAGKSALALAIARTQGGVVVNADALQVWSCWRVLTARPDAADEAVAPHLLYGHVARGRSYSVGDWLADVAPILARQRAIIVGGTGLYLTALTQGLAVIPPVAPVIRAEADALSLPDLLAGLDARTAAGLDRQNRARVQRAWEVLRATGRGLADWQARTGPPLLAPESAHRLVLLPDRDWLADRIAHRFDAMLAAGAMDEVRANAPHWQPRAQWARAIGAPELMAHLEGRMTLAEAREAAIIATRQYAKSQRSWFRNRMRDWQTLPLPGDDS